MTTIIENKLGRVDVKDGIATLTMKMEGRANKINQDFVEGFAAAVEAIYAVEGLSGVIIASGHKDFCVGADLDMIFSERDPARIYQASTVLNELFRKLETGGVPVVAALTGSALGGGYELALACHHRVAIGSPRCQYGLPEVSLGVIPGGGGTQRLPRLVGIQPALEMIVQGQVIRGHKAKGKGLVDAVAEDREGVLALAQGFIAATPKAKQPWDEGRFRWKGIRPQSMDAMNVYTAGAAMLYKKTAGAFRAPEIAMNVIQEGSRLDFDRALEVESRAFAAIVVSDQAKDMLRTLWYHRTAAEKQEGLPTADDDGFDKISILGAGMMGAGLAFICAQAGYNVVLKDIKAEAVEQGLAHCTAQARKLKWLSEADQDAILKRITGTVELEDVRGSDLVIEAVFESKDLKHRVTRETEPLLAEGGIWASNTSAIPITDLAEASSNPAAFIGLHFFSPVEKMPLLEIIAGAGTSEQTLGRCLAFARKIKKTVIVVNDGYGFFTSRVFSSYILEGAQLVAEGYDPRVIEWAARSEGMVVGPLQVFDEVTLTLGVKAMTQAEAYLGPRDLAGIQLVKDLVAQGRGGKTAGAGFYEYKDGKRRGIFPGLSAMAAPNPEPLSPDQIGRRLILAQIADVARCIDAGVLQRNRDAEVGALFGIGFAPNHGGPLAWMDRQGLSTVVAELEAAAAAWGERFAPAPRLVEMAKNGETFFGSV